MVPTSDSLEAWIEHAERRLRALAIELRRVPLAERTWRMHVRALELKRAVARWRAERPAVAERTALVAEIDDLARDVRHCLLPRVSSILAG